MANKINHLIAAYRRLNEQPAHVVLATIVETFGSTYQKAGARMLIAKDGELTGLLGGGCFEKDLMEQALSVFETEKAKAIFYDMRSPDDLIWGLGLGCNGAVRVLLQLLKAEDGFNPLNTIADTAEANTTGVLVTTFESEHPDFPVGNSLFLPSNVIDHEQPLATMPIPLAGIGSPNRISTQAAHRIACYRGLCDQGILRFDPATVAIARAGRRRRCHSCRTIRQSTWLERNRGRSSTRPYQTRPVSASRPPASYHSSGANRKP